MDENIRLAERLIRKEEKALEETIDKFAKYAAAVIYHVSKGAMTKEDIEEVTMDTFITLWNNAEKIQKDKLKGYIACIAKTRAKNKLLTLKKAVMIDIDELDPEDSFSISAETEKKELCRELTKIIDTIDEPDREIIIRHYFYYQKINSIAQALGMRSENVKVRLHRTRNKLKKLLTERGYSI